MNLALSCERSEKKKRIAIVGMGYAGLAVCWHLLKMQAGQVTLFDRHKDGNGASRISAGLLHLYPGADARFAEYGYEGLKATQALIEVASGFSKQPINSQKGLLRFAMHAKQRASFLQRAEKHSDLTFLTEEEVAERVPQLPMRPALWIPDALVIDTALYLDGLLQACLKEGALYVQQEVKPDSTWHGLNLSEDFDVVVMAMGAECLGYAQLKELPLRAIKGQVIELQLPENCPPLDYPLTGDCYMIPDQANRRCLVGATFEKEFTSSLPDLAVAEKFLRTRVEAIVPQLTEAPLLAVRAGVRLTTPQHTLIAKQIAPRLWVFTALGSKGLLHHALLGQRLAQQICAV